MFRLVLLAAIIVEWVDGVNFGRWMLRQQSTLITAPVQPVSIRAGNGLFATAIGTIGDSSSSWPRTSAIRWTPVGGTGSGLWTGTYGPCCGCSCCCGGT